MQPTVPTVTVHTNGNGCDPSEPIKFEMFADVHSPNDIGERCELSMFATQKRISFEERDDFLEKITATSDNQHQRLVVRVSVVLPYRSTVQSLSNQIQDLRSTDVLTYSKLRDELPTNSRPLVLLDRYVKASFSIDESRDVRIQPFLLIDRTCRIVTFLGCHGAERTARVCCHGSRERVAQDTYGFSSI